MPSESLSLEHFLNGFLEIGTKAYQSFGVHGKQLIARPLVMEKGHGFTCTCWSPYEDAANVLLEFDSYGAGMVFAWKSRAETDGVAAFDFIKNNRAGLAVSICMGDEVLGSPEELANLDVTSAYENAAGRVKFKVRGRHFEDEMRQSFLGICMGFALLAAGIYEKLDMCRDEGADSEGEAHLSTSIRYERSRANRMRCLAFHGARCAVCGFDPVEFYGQDFREVIEVHHIVPISQMGGPRKIDPKTDLIPLCPNCHRAIHKTNPPTMPEKLRSIIESKRIND